MKCRECNCENPEGSKYCKQCGTPFSEELEAPNLSPEPVPAPASAPPVSEPPPKKSRRGIVVLAITGAVLIFIAVLIVTALTDVSQDRNEIKPKPASYTVRYEPKKPDPTPDVTEAEKKPERPRTEITEDFSFLLKDLKLGMTYDEAMNTSFLKNIEPKSTYDEHYDDYGGEEGDGVTTYGFLKTEDGWYYHYTLMFSPDGELCAITLSAWDEPTYDMLMSEKENLVQRYGKAYGSVEDLDEANDIPFYQEYWKLDGCFIMVSHQDYFNNANFFFCLDPLWEQFYYTSD